MGLKANLHGIPENRDEWIDRNIDNIYHPWESFLNIPRESFSKIFSPILFVSTVQILLM